ncbi:MAG: extracellular solute-binding protein [Oscillospiraceae bacterium]
MIKRIMLIFMVMIMSISLVSCDNFKKQYNTKEIITQKQLSKDKTDITVLVKNAFTINTFERAVEQKFPEVNIIQVGNFSQDMGTSEYKARLKHNDLTDIVMTWPLEVGREFWKDRFLDLSTLPLSGKYTTGMLNTISQDGKLYYLPGPSQIRGIVYNKTLFKEKGWKVPNNFSGFINLCKQIEQSGIRSLQFGFGNSEVLDTAFIGYSYEDCFSKPEDMRWINDYSDGIGKFADHFTPALETFQYMIDAGIFKSSDLNVTYAEREKMLFSRQCAMVEDSVILTHMGYGVAGSTDEFALMPFFNETENASWARIYPICFIGANKELANPQNKVKLDLVMKVLEYISTTEGQESLCGDTGGMLSSLKDMPPPQAPEIADMMPALVHGKYAAFNPIKNAPRALRRGLSAMLSGTKTIAEVCAAVDKENLSPPTPWTPVILGSASEDFSLIDTANYITDEMCKKSGCEIALFLDNGKDGRNNGKGINGRFYNGVITSTDIKRIMPDLRHNETGELCKIKMTGEDLLNTLEHSILIDNDIDGWFYYFSGLKMEFSPAAPLGERISKVADKDGNKIDKDRLYSIAIMDGSVNENFIKDCDKTGILIKDIISTSISSNKVISPSKDGRLQIYYNVN